MKLLTVNGKHEPSPYSDNRHYGLLDWSVATATLPLFVTHHDADFHWDGYACLDIFRLFIEILAEGTNVDSFLETETITG